MRDKRLQRVLEIYEGKGFSFYGGELWNQKDVNDDWCSFNSFKFTWYDTGNEKHYQPLNKNSMEHQPNILKR